jgi:hypothetical protein
MAKVYMVYGASDGPIGIFGSVSKAQDCAEMYIERKAEKEELELMTQLRKDTHSLVEMFGDHTSASIQTFDVNYNPLK